MPKYIIILLFLSGCLEVEIVVPEDDKPTKKDVVVEIDDAGVDASGQD